MARVTLIIEDRRDGQDVDLHTHFDPPNIDVANLTPAQVFAARILQFVNSDPSFVLGDSKEEA